MINVLGVAIQTPQLIGIIGGCCVFTITISTVIYLLFKSGSWSKFIGELQEGKPLFETKVSPAISAIPRLYDHLVDAMSTGVAVLKDICLKGKIVTVRPVVAADLDGILLACNGSALYHESTYDPSRLWMWCTNTAVIEQDGKEVFHYPSECKDSLSRYLFHGYAPVEASKLKRAKSTEEISSLASDGIVLAILCNDFDHPIGTVKVTRCDFSNLTVEIGFSSMSIIVYYFRGYVDHACLPREILLA